MQSKQNTNTIESTHTAAAHVQGVNSTSWGLTKATLGSALVAGAIVLFAWLPAEHGIDPSGVGHALGLTEMGQIKQQLHLEADAEAADAAAAADDLKAEQLANQAQTNANITEQLATIQSQLSAIEQKISGSLSTSNAQPTATTDKPDSTQSSSTWLHEEDYTLAPGQGIEVKLVMDEGAVAIFEWNANGSVVNHDTHGDALDKSISYKQGRSVSAQSGKLTAAFDGNHGWFWRNRTEAEVVVTLRTRGDYKGIIPP